MIWELQHPFSVLTAPLTPTALGARLGTMAAPGNRPTPTQKAGAALAHRGKVKDFYGQPAAQGRTGSRTAQQQLPQLLPAAREAQEERGLSPASRDCCSCELPFPMASFGPEPRFHSTHTAASSGSALPEAAGMPAARTQPL